MKRIAFLFAMLLALSACAGEEPPSSARESPAPTDVSIAGFAFEPPQIEVDRGDAVTWVNRDDITHTVTSGRPKRQGIPGVSKDRDAEPDGTFDSGTMELDDAFTHTFDEQGTFIYYCAIHAGMKARIVVR